MPVTITTFAATAVEAIDFYLGGDALAQYIQDKPLMKALIAKQSTIPSGYEFVQKPVTFADVGHETDGFDFYTTDDEVAFPHDNNVLQAKWGWREVHAGMAITETELTRDGISITDGKKPTKISGREKTAINNLLDTKLNGMAEGWARNFDMALHRDGTQDAQAFVGLTGMILDDPTTVADVGGIAQGTYTQWRNRALVGTNKIAASPVAQTLSKTLRSEVRQLRRYGGRPDLIIAGSGFIDKLESEIAEKGIYTQSGFAKDTDVSMGGISMRGVGTVQYDPTLDDLSRSNFAYFIDTSKLGLTVLEGRDRVRRTPERPYNQYVFLSAMTWAGTPHCWQRNCHGVYEAA
jgi:hypothetical protein